MSETLTVADLKRMQTYYQCADSYMKRTVALELIAALLAERRRREKAEKVLRWFANLELTDEISAGGIRERARLYFEEVDHAKTSPDPDSNEE